MLRTSVANNTLSQYRRCENSGLHGELPGSPPGLLPSGATLYAFSDAFPIGHHLSQTR